MLDDTIILTGIGSLVVLICIILIAEIIETRKDKAELQEKIKQQGISLRACKSRATKDRARLQEIAHELRDEAAKNVARQREAIREWENKTVIAERSLKVLFNRSYPEIIKLAGIINEAPEIPQEYVRRVELYITRLEQCRKQKRIFAEKHPIVSGASRRIDSITREEFLAKEKNRCLAYAEEHELKPPPLTELSVSSYKVIDGDTFIALTEFGEYVVRTVGYDAPETMRPNHPVEHYGPEATKQFRELLDRGNEIKLVLDNKQVEDNWVFDRYGRLLAHVYIDGILTGIPMLEGGFARVLDVFPHQSDILAQYKVAQAKAKANNIGLWEYFNTRMSKKKKLLQTAMALDKEEDMYEEAVLTTLADLIDSILIKSRRRLVLHSPDCGHVKLIKSDNKVSMKVTPKLVEGLVLCKHCQQRVKQDGLLELIVDVVEEDK